MKACTELAQETLLNLMDLTDRQPTVARKMLAATALMVACVPCVIVLDIAWHWAKTDPNNEIELYPN
jgi:hypothetical protein